jgi:hypothetical protein
MARDFVRRHAAVAEKLQNELGGAIERRAGKLGFVRQRLNPWDDGPPRLAPGDASIGGPADVVVVRNGRTVAMVHLHPGHYRSSLTFSDTDIASAREAGIDDYVSVDGGRSILKFDPAANTITRLPGVFGALP